MALENLVGDDKFITALVDTNPTGGDDKREGDNHIRGIKNVLLNSFPNISSQVQATGAELDQLTDNTFDSTVTVTGDVNMGGAATNKLTIASNAPFSGGAGRAFLNFSASDYANIAYVGFGGAPFSQMDIYNEVGDLVLWGGAVEGLRVNQAGVVSVQALEVGYRDLPYAGTLGAGSAIGPAVRGKLVKASGNVDLSDGTGMKQGDIVTVLNDGASPINIYPRPPFVLAWVGNGLQGARVLSAGGMATIWFNSASGAWISGTGLS